MKEKFEKIHALVIKAVQESKLFYVFAGEGIRGSVLFRILCLPDAVFAHIRKKYGKKIEKSVFASEKALRLCLLAFLAIVPFNSRLSPAAGAALTVAYVLRAASRTGFARQTRPIDALVVMFAVIFAAASGGVSLNGVFALIIYLIITKIIDPAMWQKAATAFMLGSAIAAIAGRLGTGRFYTEFYILSIPFGFAAARGMEKNCKTLTYGFSALLAFVFATTLSKGTITPAGLALCLFLCVRGLRFVLPVLAAAGAAFGIFSSGIGAARDYSFSFASGILTLAMSGVFYLCLINYSSRRRFSKTAAAALASGSAAFLSGGGKGGMEFMFFTILALVSSNIEIKK